MKRNWNMSTSGESKNTQTITDTGGRVVGEHPLPSALTAFGIGVGAGLLAAAVLGRSRQQEEETFARQVSHHVQDALSKILPGTIAKHLS
jgi:hypothetical protein